MPPLVIPNTVRANIVWSLSGAEYAVNVLHYMVGGATVINQAAADDFAADVGVAFDTSGLKALFGTVVSLSRASLRDLRSANQPEYSGTIALAGESANDVLPLQTALCVTLRTALAGRSYRGRTYLSGWAENANQGNGTASAGAILAAESFIQQLEAVTVAGNEWNLGVASPTLGEINAVISSGCRDGVWDTQRRRAYPGI